MNSLIQLEPKEGEVLTEEEFNKNKTNAKKPAEETNADAERRYRMERQMSAILQSNGLGLGSYEPRMTESMLPDLFELY